METKQLKADTKKKKQYLKYYERNKNAGKRPMTWAQWLQGKQGEGMGMTGRNAAQYGRLSKGDADAIRKMLGK